MQFKKLIPALILFFAVFAIFGIISSYAEIFSPKPSYMSREYILSAISSETPVYYSNETNKIGVFFSKDHRQYVEFKDIPKNLINAVIAAEDKDFYKHSGFSAKSILRALYKNLKAGKWVQGGSTITQQTAKNVFMKRSQYPRANLKAKFEELIDAVKLERNFSKDEILEFYLNQFYVNANGRGVGIAAKYFFNKSVQNLNLVECAFIAGSLRSPNNYNPLIKDDPIEKALIVKKAFDRKNYVLNNMHALKMMSELEYEEAKNSKINFNYGQFAFDTNVLLDLVKNELASKEMQEILASHGIENFAASGIKIVTSIDEDIQVPTEYIFKKKLSYLDTILSGYVPLKSKNDDAPQIIELNKFYTAQIRHIFLGKGKDTYLEAQIGQHLIRVDYEGLMNMANPLAKRERGQWVSANTGDVSQLLSKLKEDNTILISTRVFDAKNSIYLADLEKLPILNGGINILDKGLIVAQMGGFTNKFYNRATQAKRQLGSIFKPLLYTAALQLKWNPLDILPNTKNVFPYMSSYYIPEPDHWPAPQEVSLAWAGAKSENLASIYLLYHLLDKLNLDEFKIITDSVGLARKQDETYDAYAKRLRDENGILMLSKKIAPAILESAKEEIIADIIFTQHFDDLEAIQKMNYGNYFEDFITLLKQSKDDIPNKSERIALLKNNFLQLSKLKKDITKNVRNLAGVYLGNLVSLDSFGLLQQKFHGEFDVTKHNLSYTPEILFLHQDFRLVVSLKYLQKLALKMGISTMLDPVLSLPLGSTSVSIHDISNLYQTIASGNRYFITNKDAGETSDKLYVTPPKLIKKIIGPENELIYLATTKEEKAIEPQISHGISNILNAVTNYGTAKTLSGNLALSSQDDETDSILNTYKIKIPSFGKTGTANDYRNSSFVGLLPYYTGDNDGTLDHANSYVIASYIGYDNNDPLTYKNFKISGAQGALQIWSDIARQIIKNKSYTDKIDVFDMIFNDHSTLPLKKYPDSINVSVNIQDGIPTNNISQNSVLFETLGEQNDEEITFKRYFAPIQSH